MAEEAPSNPSSEQKDEGSAAAQAQDSNNASTEATSLPPTTDNNDNDKPFNAGDLDDIEMENIHHQRKNDVSINKITPLIQDMVEADPESVEDPFIKATKNNDEKVDTTQKQTVLSIEYGHCSEQGIRPSMEDQVVVESTLNVFGSKCTSGQLSIYGVFDGHGGSQCAEFCASHLITILTTYLLSQESVITAFTLCISDLDEKVIESAHDASGSTCCIVLIDRKTFDIWCCNVGDSRCILINNDYTKVKQLSIEHKPDYPLEKQRIENANGWVTFGRVCGLLAVSRSLGDKDFKYEIENLVISTPDVTHHEWRLNEDQFIVLACDGLFDVFSNQQCMEWMGKENENENEIQSLTEQLVKDAIHVRKSKDNVSVLVLHIGSIQIDMDEEEEDEEDHEMNLNLNLNEFNGTQEIKEADKIYNSTSSNGSVGSAISSNQNVNDSNQNENDNNNNEPNEASLQQPKKHKFHVVMASDDNIQMQ